MKIRTLDDLVASIDSELAWRRRELHNFKGAVVNGRPSLLPHFCRASVLLAYSHWEGFVKNTCLAYVEYVSRKKLPFDQLSTNFVALACMRALKEAGQSRSPLPYIQLIDFLRLNGTENSRVPFKDVVDTESNLSSEVLQKLLLALGIPIDNTFILKKQFIDRNLLKTRNEIAHGERTEVSEELASEIFSQVESLLQGFKIAVENAAAQRLFERNPSL
ncbi:MAE_28990/MAE_18760 family HEPN-like nuclease [Burkholderia gladioli]|uniref:MAE_28990/MAE_18760 family HEPN-like nuclease n=1 Tax=Burkholderia gladioli TaxID=28095 RepID=UPI00164122BE|nr:MAE_28990/MAE_18760 family HEPN-like nuclease [Burkholderia gladioli]